MKEKLVLLITLLLLSSPVVDVRAEETIRRRPDQTEFVTESHVRLTTESLTIAEVTEATPAATIRPSLWDYLAQSLAAFLQSLKDIFNLD